MYFPALEGFTETLSMELEPAWNIKVSQLLQRWSNSTSIQS